VRSRLGHAHSKTARRSWDRRVRERRRYSPARREEGSTGPGGHAAVAGQWLEQVAGQLENAQALAQPTGAMCGARTGELSCFYTGFLSLPRIGQRISFCVTAVANLGKDATKAQTEAAAFHLLLQGHATVKHSSAFANVPSRDRHCYLLTNTKTYSTRIRSPITLNFWLPFWAKSVCAIVPCF
jgi:hypothetical protein